MFLSILINRQKQPLRNSRGNLFCSILVAFYLQFHNNVIFFSRKVTHEYCYRVNWSCFCLISPFTINFSFCIICLFFVTNLFSFYLFICSFFRGVLFICFLFIFVLICNFIYLFIHFLLVVSIIFLRGLKSETYLHCLTE